MYYFGTNEEAKFAVPDFWPKPHETHRIPFEREELKKLGEELRTVRLNKRDERRRREAEERGELYVPAKRETLVEDGGRGGIDAVGREVGGGSWRSRSIGPGAIDRWARGDL